jgi:ketosteroid isomerase-like protein
MSNGTAQFVRRLYRMFSDGSALVPELFQPDVELRPLLIGGGALEGAVYRGHDGIREFISTQKDTWERVSVEPVNISQAGEYVLVETRIEAVGRASGIELTQMTWNRIKLRDGKVASIRVFAERGDAVPAGRAAADPV